jgi:hypothetical protein
MEVRGRETRQACERFMDPRNPIDLRDVEVPSVV